MSAPHSVATDWEEQIAKLDAMAELRPGWNGYNAPAPNEAALRGARSFLSTLQQHRLPPHRVAPSVMGGVGVTLRHEARKVYVEFYNDGTAHALFSAGQDDMHTRPVSISAEGFATLLDEARKYLDG